MSFNNINTKLRSERGFTIVELLIVIVVIGILAAITIVSFNGVTAKANTASAQSAAETVIKKVEAYNASTGSYPTSYGALTDSTKTNEAYYVSGVVFAQSLSATQDKPSTVILSSCGTTGMSVQYWKYDATAGIQTMYTGAATSGSTCTKLTS